MASGTISGAIAKTLFDILWREGGDPAAVVEARNMRQITDSNAIERVIDRVIADNGDKAEKAKGKPNLAASLAGWFVGQAIRGADGTADPKTVNELARKKLGFQASSLTGFPRGLSRRQGTFANGDIPRQRKRLRRTETDTPARPVPWRG